ncbi:amino acid/amide ABC transporter ATP-binding protein 2, HAAT family [Marinobacter daqiaonensis]|uniref:Amino acid/amide ABC transporter ATP-binding protein 2, HAAT family n=1 Tax=Marinobacter daqiaonensis TaxID=650891 RepID=A0A1I6IBS0_9GAMM|nr:ATP-binding cassette domain-containing protein [Marinobacter daqiaonensis]SFR64197.1 amino acid/amide ABC transporter ATP-binding protein 2, HAAT family [Marinobacter daqiaonensis]
MSLEISNLDVSIEGIGILRNVNLNIPGGQMAGLIGHNGAGKTTLIRAIMGLLPATRGSIIFKGQDLTRLPAHRRGNMAISYMPEDRRLIPELTVTENMLMPAWANRIADGEQRLKWVYSLMPEIADFGERKALQLSGGQQKLVALGRALIPGRELILLDEPFEGVAPVLAQRLSSVIADLRGEGLTVLIAESDDAHSAGLVDTNWRIERGSVSQGRRDRSESSAVADD